MKEQKIIVKPILEDKFWIVEQDEERIGTMSLNDDRYMFSNQTETCFFDNKRQMKKKFGVHFFFETSRAYIYVTKYS